MNGDGGRLEGVWQPQSSGYLADTKVLGGMSESLRATPVTGLNSDPRAGPGLAPWHQSCALESGGGEEPGKLALCLGWT